MPLVFLSTGERRQLPAETWRGNVGFCFEPTSTRKRQPDDGFQVGDKGAAISRLGGSSGWLGLRECS
jgi:hypothetical protein